MYVCDDEGGGKEYISGREIVALEGRVDVCTLFGLVNKLDAKPSLVDIILLLLGKHNCR
jgi:hypothetical protein